MPEMTLDELRYRLMRYARMGSKESRRRTIARCLDLLDRVGGNHSTHISRAHAYAWIEESNSVQRYYAAALIWRILDRKPLPKPRVLRG